MHPMIPTASHPSPSSSLSSCFSPFGVGEVSGPELHYYDDTRAYCGFSGSGPLGVEDTNGLCTGGGLFRTGMHAEMRAVHMVFILHPTDSFFHSRGLTAQSFTSKRSSIYDTIPRRPSTVKSVWQVKRAFGLTDSAPPGPLRFQAIVDTSELRTRNDKRSTRPPKCLVILPCTVITNASSQRT